MRVTNSMLLSSSMADLDTLREKYAKAQNAVNGRVLERPSEDPQRVVEAMDLSGAKLRVERYKRSAEDAREWLSVAENSISAMIDKLQGAREVALQSGSPANLSPEAREGLARLVESIREALKQEMNGRHRGQYLFSGWRTTTKPFDDSPTGGVSYTSGSTGEMTRELGQGLHVVVNVPGNKLLDGGDFIQTLSDIAADLRAGATESVFTTQLGKLDAAMDNLSAIRSSLGIRQQQAEQYEDLSDKTLLSIEERLTKITGADLEVSVIKMSEAQTAYQAALMAFSKALPATLMEYMMR